jgi:hypothetical protein
VKKLQVLYIFLAAGLMPASASAYVGPGLGVDAVGVLMGVLFALSMLFLGIVWYPLKKLSKALFNPVSASRNKETDVKRKA